MAKQSIRWATAFVFAVALPLAAHSHPGMAATKEVKTAAAHAGMAMGAADLKMAQAHLQHVVNCLVGPSGDGYDAQAENPCKGMGQGAIVDAKGDAARVSRLQAAAMEARQGMNASSVDEVHASAQKVMTSLQADQGPSA
ncbi:hypothetical protein ACFWZ4_09390 [Frateuria sp. GZRe12]|uniref:hypothetical protein n=1 Tax=Frateuria sp. GZRe12 TaxID=3351533 RepID=UPI003EDC1F64